jgi:hypothetical protein
VNVDYLLSVWQYASLSQALLNFLWVKPWFDKLLDLVHLVILIWCKLQPDALYCSCYFSSIAKFMEKISIDHKKEFIDRLHSYWTLKRDAYSGVSLLSMTATNVIRCQVSSFGKTTSRLAHVYCWQIVTSCFCSDCSVDNTFYGITSFVEFTIYQGSR